MDKEKVVCIHNGILTGPGRMDFCLFNSNVIRNGRHYANDKVSHRKINNI